MDETKNNQFIDEIQLDCCYVSAEGVVIKNLNRFTA